MRLGSNQKEILEFHCLGRRAFRQPHPLALAEEEGDRVPNLHAGKMNANAGACTRAERVESCLCVGGVCFCWDLFVRGEPAVRVEAAGRQYTGTQRGVMRRTSRGPTKCSHRGGMCKLGSRRLLLAGCSGLLVCCHRVVQYEGDCSEQRHTGGGFPR
jgi:hypothetical protein